MCPFVNHTDRRCAAHLTMRNLDSAFGHCANHYVSCPVFQEMIVHHEDEREDAHYETPQPAWV